MLCMFNLSLLLHICLQISYFGCKEYDLAYKDFGNFITLPTNTQSYSVKLLTPATHYQFSIKLIKSLNVSTANSTQLAIQTKPGGKYIM